MDRKQTSLLELGRLLKASGYRFTTPTPQTHQLVNRRECAAEGRSLTDIFGWSRPFSEDALPTELARLLDEGGGLERTGTRLRSAVRFSTLDDLLLLHSAFPTEAGDAVFFGPDTYRFARAIELAVRADAFPSPATIIDIGAGSGAGGLVARRLFPDARLILADINCQALRLAEVNAALNDVRAVELRESDVLESVPEPGGLIVSNPPYLVDGAERIYRHGGGRWGVDLSVRIVSEALDHLAPGGRLVVYTGTPVVEGVDIFLEAVRPSFAGRDMAFGYEEIDPDVFGEELMRAPYDGADRIAAVLLVADAPNQGVR